MKRKFAVMLSKVLFLPVTWSAVLLYRPLKKVFGDKVVEIYCEALAFAGRMRAKPLAKFLAVNTSDAGELGKIQDFEDEVFGVKGVWKERGKTKAVKVETYCPFAKFVDSDFCRKAVARFEEETFGKLNPSYKLSIEGKLLSEGGDGCIFIHEVKRSGKSRRL